jgi:hypothetical protein
MPELRWLDGYSGETVDELLALEGKHRTDSLVLAFEQAIDQKAARVGEHNLSDEECIILAIEALEREVNNGGYGQFFVNSSREYAPKIVQGCLQTAEITQKALNVVQETPMIVPPSEAVVMGNRVGLMIIAAWVLMFSSPAGTRAQDVDKDRDETKAIKAMVEESLGWYHVFADASDTEEMTPHPVLRWRNATRGTQESEGVLVLWVHNGRPEASAGIYPWEGNLCHEFVSLSGTAKLVAREAGRVIWSPETPGVEYKEIPGAPAPASTSAARLRQMKLLADRFKVTMTGWKADKSDREELRLLPKPLYRAEPSGVRTAEPARIDGEVFAFVQGTDPEAVLLLEAVRQNGRSRWQYAFARATSGGLEARLDGAVERAVDFLVGQSTSQQPQLTVRHPLPTAAPGR